MKFLNEARQAAVVETLLAVASAEPERWKPGGRTSQAFAVEYEFRAGPSECVGSHKKIIGVLNDAKVSFVLMGGHALGGWRSRPRATQDVDLLVAKKHHVKAVRVLRQVFFFKQKTAYEITV